MVRRSVVRMTVAALAALVFMPASLVFGQGIAGVVKDTSGGVLPGVTVEASSPALIENTRTVVSDDQGQYSIIDLRPGVYTVTFVHILISGLPFHNAARSNQSTARNDVSMVEEFALETSAISAEYAEGGVTTNLVGKEGSNRFGGSVLYHLYRQRDAGQQS